MRTKFKFALMAAAAALSLGFSSCASDDVVAEDVNPNYNPETGEVTTNFVFSVSTGNQATTRMTAANTQADLSQNFRGISDAYLLSFKLGIDNDGKHISTATTADKAYSLGALISAGQLDPDATGTETKSRRVIELALPTETNALMFWGKAPKTLTDNEQGKITTTYGTDTKNISDYKFSLVSRLGNTTEFNKYANLIATFLNTLCETGIDKKVTYGGVTTADNVVVKWSDYANITTGGITAKTKSPYDDNLDISPLGEILADAFVTFNTVNGGEVRAGSGPSVSRQIADLYQIINKVAQATATNMQEEVAKQVALSITTKISAAFSEASTNCNWQDASDVATAAAYTGDVPTGNLKDFPVGAFGIPMGGTQLTTTLTAGKVTWSYLTQLPLYSMGGGDGASVLNYMYPAELCYFGNSPIRVTSDAHVTADYPDGASNWDDDNQWKAGTNNNTVAWAKASHVVSTTRSVAMQENINYGTALLKSSVKYADGITYLEDNNHAIQKSKNSSLADTEELNKQIAISGNPFTLTGILIGGQAQNMGWDYLPVSGEKFDKMIYDTALPSTTIPTPTGSENYTLVWDNWNAASKGSKQNDVYVCLEFINNTNADFYGKYNLVRSGGTFYITGKLDPDAGLSTSDRSAGITWPTTPTGATRPLYALPPYDTDGSTIKERRVFIQDYMTTATFVLGQQSLQEAYVTVPDLRSTQISLGLSVDLSWSTGLTFSNVPLGQ